MRSVLVLCVLAACYHDSAPGPVANPPARARRVHAQASDPISFLPVDSEIVLLLDVHQLRASALWKTIELPMSAKLGDALARFRSQCGVDPLQSIRQIAIGFKGLEDKPGPSGVFVMRGVDRKEVMACMDRLVGTDPRVTIGNGVVTVKATPGENPSAFTFANGSTLVGLVHPTASPEELAAVLKSGAPLRGSPTFVELLGQIQTRGTAWFALNGNSKVFDKMSAFGFRPKAITGSIDLANGFSGAVRMRLDSADSARNLVGLGQPQLGQLKALFEEVELASEDVDVVFRVVMTQAQLDTVVGMLGMFTAGP